MKQVVKTDKAPAPIGPYNQAIIVDNTVYVSGQIAIHPESGQLVIEDIVAETHQVMQNIKAILDAAGITFNDVVKTTIFLSDMNLFATVNEVYGIYFSENFPARETIAVKGLPKNVHVEISVIATK
ncbi:MAG: RidA family protein [Bacteroidota bacterium]|nr:RidA family protein [Bacteroidota bacterium]